MEEKLEILYKECLEELNKIGISFKEKEIKICISKRNNKRYGCCKPEVPDEKYKRVIKKGFRYIIKYENYKKYTIEISKWVLQLNDNIIKNTIIHELIHCLPNCNNHGKYFKIYANLVNKELGYNITRMGNKKEDYIKSNVEYKEKEEFNYHIKCTNCGQEFLRKRLDKNFIRKYRCGICKGKLELLRK